MTFKVVQWGTGNLGTLAVQSILKHPDLELIGNLGVVIAEGRPRCG